MFKKNTKKALWAFIGLYLIAEFVRDFLFVLQKGNLPPPPPPPSALPPPSLSQSRGAERGIGERGFDLTGDFLLVSKHCQHEEEDELISQVGVERVDSNSGVETRQGPKKKKKRKWEVKPRPQYSRMPQWNLNQKTLQSDRAVGGGRGAGLKGPRLHWVKGTRCLCNC